MIRRESRTLFRGLLLGAACAMAGCGSSPTGNESVAATLPLNADSTARVEDYVLVDCLLPGQIRRLGTSMTYLTPRRAVKATQRDCAIRGGEYVLFDRSDYGSALQTLLPKARAGDPVAQTYVGEIYEKGLGLPGPDYGMAASWYRKAAEGGHSPAQVSLGSLYERGLGVPSDKAAALDWYRRSTGLTQDRLIFESALKAEREAFQRELALRNQVASSLQQQLRQSKQRKATPAAPSSPQTPAARSAGTQEIERLIESQRRDAQREAELREKKLRAVEQLRATESEGTGQAEGKAAQAGKLELSLRQELDSLNRLAAAK